MAACLAILMVGSALAVSAPDAAAASSAEQAIAAEAANYINQERAARGLPSVSWRFDENIRGQMSNGCSDPMGGINSNLPSYPEMRWAVMTCEPARSPNTGGTSGGAVWNLFNSSGHSKILTKKYAEEIRIGAWCNPSNGQLRFGAWIVYPDPLINGNDDVSVPANPIGPQRVSRTQGTQFAGSPPTTTPAPTAPPTTKAPVTSPPTTARPTPTTTPRTSAPTTPRPSSSGSSRPTTTTPRIPPTSTAPVVSRTKRKDGSTVVKRKDGSETVIRKDGTEVTTLKDGTKVIRSKDGTTTMTTPDGQRVTEDADGNTTVEKTTTPTTRGEGADDVTSTSLTETGVASGANSGPGSDNTASSSIPPTGWFIAGGIVLLAGAWFVLRRRLALR